MLPLRERQSRLHTCRQEAQGETQPDPRDSTVVRLSALFGRCDLYPSPFHLHGQPLDRFSRHPVRKRSTSLTVVLGRSSDCFGISRGTDLHNPMQVLLRSRGHRVEPRYRQRRRRLRLRPATAFSLHLLPSWVLLESPHWPPTQRLLATSCTKLRVPLPSNPLGQR